MSETWSNPIPVAICLCPMGGGLLGVRRGIEPKMGEIALPGGYIESGETWREACVRELREETGVVVPATDVTLYAVEDVVARNVLLIFGFVPWQPEVDMSFKCKETMELVKIGWDTSIAFPVHKTVIDLYLKSRLDG